MKRLIWHRRALACLLLVLMLPASAAQEYADAISADNLSRLRPYARIDFSGLGAKPNIGWFAANGDASEFLLLGSAGEIFSVSLSHDSRRRLIRLGQGAQAYGLIDGILIKSEPIILHQLDGKYLINENILATDNVPVALFRGSSENELFVEMTADNRQALFQRYRMDRGTDEWVARDVIPFPVWADAAPVMRIGRVKFPVLILSALSESKLYFQIYSDSFGEFINREYQLGKGPAVFGAVNAPPVSHFAWTNPSREELNMLDLETGENRFVATLGGAYPQYLLLAQDASAILAVNLDFQPAVVAWDAISGERYELGLYRECGRIPDKVALSRDGRSLIIGCDTGLDIWRVYGEKGRN